MKIRTILFIFGTRPEAIKLVPLILALRERRAQYAVQICVTAQHRELLDQVLGLFSLVPDFDLDLMRPDQDLYSITSAAVEKLGPVLSHTSPDLVIVQGDTTTAFVGALAAFYKKIRVAHIEAGLRSGDKYAPFPEEMNRMLVSRLADFHFTPTDQSSENLRKEGITKNVSCVGNTVIDALHLALERVRLNSVTYESSFQDIDFTKKIILMTCHRRENFGEPFERICAAVNELAAARSDIEFVYPVHPNPNVKGRAHQLLKGVNVKLIEPIGYPHFVWLLDRSFLVLTDSGGLQEEAPALGKPVLVMRDVTERGEALDAGTARLVGTDKSAIVSALSELLDDEKAYERMSKATNPFGDGKSAARIVDIISGFFEK
jgi:UDP-N-acetylglucosamine 2-epimerase (non-hydrolysing)